MIKAVFFDFYDTIVRFDPPREELQARACSEFGLEIDQSALPYGYWVADDFLSRENSRYSLNQRSPDELKHFWAQYEATILREAGIEVSDDLALKIVTRLRQLDRGLKLFDDVVPALETLRDIGITLGLISNLNHDLKAYCDELGLTSYMDFAITSYEVGAEKPHPPIFLAALDRSRADASEAIHVGDQYESDVLGARGAGITPLLLDRLGFWKDVTDCARITSLEEITEHL